MSLSFQKAQVSIVTFIFLYNKRSKNFDKSRIVAKQILRRSQDRGKAVNDGHDVRVRIVRQSRCTCTGSCATVCTRLDEVVCCTTGCIT